MTKRKRKNDLQNTTQKTKDRATQPPSLPKNWGELRCTGRVISSCSTCYARRIILLNDTNIYGYGNCVKTPVYVNIQITQIYVNPLTKQTGVKTNRTSFLPQALVSFKKYMPPPLPYKNICPPPLPYLVRKRIFFNETSACGFYAEIEADITTRN